MSSRIFTDEELEELGTRTLDLVTAAIDGGDKERAKQLAERMHKELVGFKHAYVDKLAAMYTYIYRKDGAETLEQVARAVSRLHTVQRDPWTLDFRKRVIGQVRAFRGHGQPMKVEEDDEKVTIRMMPCGGGQMHVARGGYERGDFCMIQEALPLTWSMSDFPIYCIHHPARQMLTIEQFGHPLIHTFMPEKVGREEPCVVCTYKRLADMPDEAWTAVGKQKPAHLEGGEPVPNRVFTSEELEELGASMLDLLTGAIEAGDKERAKQLAEQMHTELRGFKDAFIDQVAAVLTYIYRKDGAAAWEEAERASWAAQCRAVHAWSERDLWTMDFRKRVVGQVKLNHGHGVPMKVEEDDEKVTVTMMPCGGGQAHVARGGYERGDFAMVHEALPITGGKTEFPVYCGHCNVATMMAIEQFGAPATYFWMPEKVGREEYCHLYIYKRKEDVPEEAWTAVGKQKPA